MALDAGSPEDDRRFGTIHPRSHIIRFSLRGHWRISLALVMLAAGSGTMLSESMEHVIGHLPKPHKSVVLARKRRLPMSLPKSARVWMPVLGPTPQKLDLVERMGDGTLLHSSYFDVSLDLHQAPPPAGSPLAAYQETVKTDDPFDLVLSRPAGPPAPANRSGRLAPVRGEAINVSLAPLSPAQPVRRLVSLPVREEALHSISGLGDIPEAELARLAEDLGATSIKPGEELDLLVRARSPDTGDLQILYVRHQSKRRGERLLARCDDGHFQEVSDRHLYDRLLAEALVDEQKRMAGGAAGPEDGRALAKALQDYPKLVAHLRQSNIPPAVSTQVIDLLRKNGIHWDKDDDDPVVDVVFRKTDAGDQDLVSVTVHRGDEEQRFYRYSTSGRGSAEYFDDGGHSVSKSLMHKPVAQGQEGDGFGWRVHPILGVRKFHNGVDFRAPEGSPIVAAGDGVVVKIASEPGYGKYVRIRHDGGYTTTYAHIAGTPKGLAIGERVSQGQVIAYVGSTGLSTGPHLYYELRVGDKYADPTKAQMAAGTTLTGRALTEFQSQVARVEAIADAIKTSATSAAEAVGHALRPGARQRPD